MTGDVLTSDRHNDSSGKLHKSKRSTQQAQEVLFNFLLEIVNARPPEDVLLEFQRLFIHHADSSSSAVVPALYEIVFANNEEEFRNTLKRSCYILVNNWGTKRQHKAIQDLIQVFSDPSITRHTVSPTLKRLRTWTLNFVNSQDFEELKLFVSRYDDQDGHWTQRYTAFLLVPQFVDLKNPIEQREAARALSRQLKDRFKFDLAMYIARSQSSTLGSKAPKNPTALGDEVIRLTKAIVARRGPFNYANVANIFLKQTQQSTYKEFKASLQEYLAFAVENQDFVDTLRKKLSEKFDSLYENYHDEVLSSALLLRTCNRVIEYLTIEQKGEPSPLFALLLSQGNPLTLVIVLLKLILICSHARTHLEACIAELVRYYEGFSEEECQWVITFMEVFNITFAIYAENVEYNLIKMNHKKQDTYEISHTDLDTYKIFSQLKSDNSLELAVELEFLPEASEIENNKLDLPDGK
ncbi:hypothetical protein H6F90_15790 [Trichocoleus sp. FACHB-591]|uniref:hypothetical protein n=1 Tax=Trichocoleus sp. FACHB-591 TaxID=2692872 RepID=UPI0016882126|nr:hypothetical protein [Trichocoleus sp. FACHB-591]MBD2096595.1 hypothetical protein [Trichocoleus sp. FACHB-591]